MAPAGEHRLHGDILEPIGDATLLDMLDTLLDKGVVLHGDVSLGLAGVDLVSLQLASVLGAVDRVLAGRERPRKRRHRRGARTLRRP